MQIVKCVKVEGVKVLRRVCTDGGNNKKREEKNVEERREREGKK